MTEAKKRQGIKEDPSLSNKIEDRTKNNLRYGPMPTFPKQRQFTRIIIVVSVCIFVYFYRSKEKEVMLASHIHSHKERAMLLPCSESYKTEIANYKGCIPYKCGRAVQDKLLTEEEVKMLQSLAELGFSLAKPEGGASILDLHSGALTYGKDFINLYTMSKGQELLKSDQFETYRTVRLKIQEAIAAQFRIEANKLYLTHPTFFSRLTSDPPKSIHDEYWHIHVDKETYESFHYTGLLYLSSYSEEFQGGRFLFVEADNSTTVVEPVIGRVSMFTSGKENTHRVERVSSGVRLALTIAFTCDSSKAITDPVVNFNSASVTID